MHDATVVAVKQPDDVPMLLQYGGPYATACAAIIAAFLATMVALRGIKASRQNLVDQLNLQRELGARASWASVVSANRQRWIDALRDDIAEFISADFVLADHARDDEMDEVRTKDDLAAIANAKQRRRLMFRRIQLRINREKPDQEALWQAVRRVMPATGAEHRRAVRELTELSTKLFRKEWLRVKAEASGEDAPLSSNIRGNAALGATADETAPNTKVPPSAD